MKSQKIILSAIFVAVLFVSIAVFASGTDIYGRVYYSTVNVSNGSYVNGSNRPYYTGAKAIDWRIDSVKYCSSCTNHYKTKVRTTLYDSSNTSKGYFDATFTTSDVGSHIYHRYGSDTASGDRHYHFNTTVGSTNYSGFTSNDVLMVSQTS